MKTENHYTETDLGNISLNPRGEYDPEAFYEYLDTVSMDGGSYMCLAELGTKITGTSPVPGINTEHWQVLTLPGGLTPEYITMHDEVVEKAKQVEVSRAAVELSQDEIEVMQADVAQLHKDTQDSAQSALVSKNQAAGYASVADVSRQAAERAKQDVDAQIPNINAKLQAALNEIDTTRQSANTSIKKQEELSVQAVKDQTGTYITEQKDLAKQEIDQKVNGLGLDVNTIKKQVTDEGNKQVEAVRSAHAAAVQDVETTKNTAIQAVQTEGTTQTGNVSAEGDKQVKAITDTGTQQTQLVKTEGQKQLADAQQAAQEIVADRNQIAKNKADITALKGYVTTSVLPTTWKEVRNAIESGLHREMYAIGDKFTNIWKDPNASMKEYDNPLRINHFQDGLELENGQLINGMWLQTRYAQLKGVQFSHQRAFLRCPDGLAPGTYYFTFESNWGNNVKAGDVVCFTTTQQIPVGGRVSGCYGAPGQTKSNWKIYTHSADGKTIIETITPTFTASGVDLGIQKSSSRSGNLNSTQEMAYGWNRWKTSAIRQYLNSDKPKNEWWVAQDEWDIVPDQLSQIDGYLKGIDPELLAVIQPVKVTTYANTVNDGGVADVTYDKVVLPSLEQMYIAPQISGEGEAHQYYKELNGTDTPYKQYETFPELITYAIENHALAQGVCLRSASRGYAYVTWYVGASGDVYDDGASYAHLPSPLVFIGASPISAPTDAELGV